MTQAQLEQMRDVDIMTVDPQTLVERKTVHVNERSPECVDTP